MYHVRNIIQFALFLWIVFFTFQQGFFTSFLTGEREISEMVMRTEDPLYREIKEKSSQYEEKPQDAYIDRVYKKTPGRKGLKVNIEASYKNMRKKGIFQESLLVFDEISPKVSLKDLPPSPIYRGHPEKNMVALMINVSWGKEYIPNILKTLKEKDVKATFFIEGKWAKENVEMLKMIHEQGHTIGNHAYNHPDMKTLNREQTFEQIDQTNRIIQTIIDETPTLFAPPSGSFKDEVVEIAHELQMETILWTVDTIDWRNPTVDVMINRVMKNIHNGAMILMHPTSPVEKGLDVLIEQIRKEGYRMNTVDVLLSDER